MTRRDTHDCPGGCGRQVPRHQLACRPDWYRLPATIRDAVNAGYHGDDASGHRRAIREALNWYRDNPRPLGRVTR